MKINKYIKVWALALLLTFGLTGCFEKNTVVNNPDGVAPVTQVSDYEDFLNKNKQYIPPAVKGIVSLTMANLSESEKEEFAKWGFVICNGLYTATTGTLPDMDAIEKMIALMGEESPELVKFQGVNEALSAMLKIKLDEVKNDFNSDAKITIEVISLFANSLSNELKAYLPTE